MSAHGHDPESCRRLVERLSEYLDEELPANACAEIERHFGDCEPCKEFLDSLRHTVAWLGDVPRPRMPDALRREMRDRLSDLRERAARDG